MTTPEEVRCDKEPVEEMAMEWGSEILKWN